MTLIEALRKQRGMTRKELAKTSRVTEEIVDKLCDGRTKVTECSALILQAVAEALGVSAEILKDDSVRQEERERAYEHGLPGYLQHDLDAYKLGLKEHSSLLDCLWGELYGSINAAQIDDGIITEEHADYLRQKFLFGDSND